MRQRILAASLLLIAALAGLGYLVVPAGATDTPCTAASLTLATSLEGINTGTVPVGASRWFKHDPTARMLYSVVALQPAGTIGFVVDLTLTVHNRSDADPCALSVACSSDGVVGPLQGQCSVNAGFYLLEIHNLGGANPASFVITASPTA